MINKKLIKKYYRLIFFRSNKYWEKRYAKGGHSGAGSYNEIAAFKTKTINAFIKDYDIKKILDYGCGDGAQCEGIEVNEYLGTDVSRTSINICEKKYENDPTRNFIVFNKNNLPKIEAYKADLVLSLDVIYHLIEDKVFKKYMKNLFRFAEKYVIIFSTNHDERMNVHHKNRNFTKYIDEHFKEWKLLSFIENPFKGKDSMADFYIYEKSK
jgi:SAM-dependent methyltransferase